MTLVVAILWLIFNFILLIFVGHEIVLLFYAVFGKRESKTAPKKLEHFPKVTVQLPIYNELFVVERLIDRICQLDYPKDKLEIQILDDSTDGTVQLVQEILASGKYSEFNLVHIRREDRKGFKAGALQHGMELSDAEYFAIFDADFLPERTFLLETLPHFHNSQIGVVQTRWTHMNEYFSPLTLAEGLMLDAHFGIEQKGRSNANGFINFNGTAGIWRRTCIEDAGGWQGDTLTEDLDLSFRAQMKKWKIKYLFHAESPSELPLTFSAYRNQQFRWSKGAAECFRKNGAQLWKTDVSFKTKIIGTLHLLNSSVYLLVLALMALAPLIYFLSYQPNQEYPILYKLLSYFGISIHLLLMTVLFTGKIICTKNKLKAVLLFIPSVFLFFSVSLGISAHMALAVLSGYRGKKSEFVRTPKFGKTKEGLPKKTRVYKQAAHFNLLLFEILFFSYGIFWLVVGLQHQDPFTMLYSAIIICAFAIALFLPNYTWSRKV